MLSALTVHVALVAAAFFAGQSILYVTGLAFVGLGLLFGAYYVWKYPTLLSLQKIISHLRRTNESMDTQAKQFSKENQNLSQQVNSLSKENENLKTTSQNLEKTKANLEREVAALTQLGQRLKQDLSTEIAHLKTALYAQGQSQAQHEETLGTVEEQLHAEVSALQQTRVDLQDILKKDFCIERLQVFHSTAQRLQEMHVEYAKTHTALQAETTLLSELVTEIDKLKKEYQQIHGSLSKEVQDLSLISRRIENCFARAGRG